MEESYFEGGIRADELELMIPIQLQPCPFANPVRGWRPSRQPWARNPRFAGIGKDRKSMEKI
jgi:hypothetical protein